MNKETTILEVLITAREDMRGAVTDSSRAIDNLARSASVGQLSIVALSAAAVAASAAMFNLARGAASEVESLEKTATALGTTIDFLQVMDHAARMNDSSVEDLTASLRIYTQHLGDAASGSTEAAKAFADLGLNVEQLLAMPLEQQLGVVSDTMNAFGTSSERAAAMASLFGRSWIDMSNVLKDGSRGLAELRAEGEALGTVMSENMVEDAKKLDDALDELSERWRGLKNRMAEVVLFLFDSVGSMGEAAVHVDGFGASFDRAAGMVRGMADALNEAKLAVDPNFFKKIVDEMRGPSDVPDIVSWTEEERRRFTMNRLARELQPTAEMGQFPTGHPSDMFGVTGKGSGVSPRLGISFDDWKDFSRDFDDWSDSLDDVPAKLDPIALQFERMGVGLRDGLADAFSQSIAEGRTWGESMRSIMRSWAVSSLYEINRIIAKLFFAAVLKAFVGGGSIPNVGVRLAGGGNQAPGQGPGEAGEFRALQMPRATTLDGAPSMVRSPVQVVISQQVGFGTRGEELNATRHIERILRQLRVSLA